MNEDPNQTAPGAAGNFFYVVGFLLLGGLFLLFVFLYLAPSIGSKDVDENINIVPENQGAGTAEQTPILVPIPELDEPNEDFPNTVPQDPDMDPGNGNTLY